MDVNVPEPDTVWCAKVVVLVSKAFAGVDQSLSVLVRTGLNLNVLSIIVGNITNSILPSVNVDVTVLLIGINLSKPRSYQCALVSLPDPLSSDLGAI